MVRILLKISLNATLFTAVKLMLYFNFKSALTYFCCRKFYVFVNNVFVQAKSCFEALNLNN